jgi:hypothetical protein
VNVPGTLPSKTVPLPPWPLLELPSPLPLPGATVLTDQAPVDPTRGAVSVPNLATARKEAVRLELTAGPEEDSQPVGPVEAMTPPIATMRSPTLQL